MDKAEIDYLENCYLYKRLNDDVSDVFVDVKSGL